MRNILLTCSGVALAVGTFFALYFFYEPAPPTLLKPGQFVGELVRADENALVLRQSGGEVSLRLGTSVRVYSEVAAGEEGKSLAEVPAGAPLSGVLAADGSVAWVQIVPPPPTSTEAPFVGMVATSTPGTLSVLSQSGRETRVFALTPTTRLLSTVATGQKGRGFETLNPGTLVAITTLPEATVIRALGGLPVF